MREIRRVEKDGQTWFMAADICNEVGITNCTIAMRAIAAEHKRKIPFGGKGMAEKQFLNEAGVHELLRRTKKPGADVFNKQFTEWVAGGMVEVDPEIAKQGIREDEWGGKTTSHATELPNETESAEDKVEMKASNAGAMSVFENAEFGKVRTVVIDGEPWFVGKDVAEALGYGSGKAPVNAVANHVDLEDKGVTEMMTPGGRQNITIINESGVYALVFSSKLEGAKRFKHWVTSEILPSIRKNGMYATENTLQQMINNPDMIVMMAQRMLDEKARADAECERADIAEAKVVELESSVSSLKAENSALVGDIVMWDSRALLNALIRKYAAVHMDNDFAGAWRAFYKELLYKEGISVAGRSKSGSKLNTLTEEEVIAGVSVAIAMCRRYAVDVEDIVGHADKVTSEVVA